MNEDSLATILLVSRIHSQGTRPLKATEYWKLKEHVAQPGVLLGQTERALVGEHGFSKEISERIIGLLDRARAMAFELEQLDQAGIWTLTPFDEGYPRRLVDRLGSKAPVLLHAAGDLGLLKCPGIGVVGSRDVNSEGGEVAQNAAERAAGRGLPLISGGARGVDQLAMSTAFQSGGTVIGVVADSLMRKLKNPDVRRAIYDDRTVICTPYSPKAPFSIGNAMGRNKLIYALSQITLVVASEIEKGGTWSGATEALKGGFGRVAVWRGPGEGPGNKRIEKLGAAPIRSIDELQAALELKDGPKPEQEEVPEEELSPAGEFSLF